VSIQTLCDDVDVVCNVGVNSCVSDCVRMKLLPEIKELEWDIRVKYYPRTVVIWSGPST
jgi:hypothetical protein